MCDNLRLIEVAMVSTEHPLVKFITTGQREWILDMGILGVYLLEKYQEHDFMFYTTFSSNSVAKRLMLFDWRLAA